MVKTREMLASALAVAALASCCKGACVTQEDTMGTSVICRGNVTLDDLQTFFKQDFPDNKFNTFKMVTAENSTKPMLLNDVFNGSSFETIYIRAPGTLEGITDDAFSASQERLSNILIEDTWPLTSLDLGAVMGPNTISIYMDQDPVHGLPKMDCAGKASYGFTYEFHNEHSEIFPDNPDHIKSIPEGFWKNCSAGMTKFQMSENLTSIEANAFTVTNHAVEDSVLYLDITNTNLSIIEPNFINVDSLPDNKNVSLKLIFMFNELTGVPENVFKKYLDMKNVQVDMHLLGNPLQCDCDMAWVVVNPSYFSMLADNPDTRCEDGKHILDLKPKHFAHCKTTAQPATTAST